MHSGSRSIRSSCCGRGIASLQNKTGSVGVQTCPGRDFPNLKSSLRQRMPCSGFDNKCFLGVGSLLLPEQKEAWIFVSLLRNPRTVDGVEASLAAQGSRAAASSKLSEHPAERSQRQHDRGCLWLPRRIICFQPLKWPKHACPSLPPLVTICGCVLSGSCRAPSAQAAYTASLYSPIIRQLLWPQEVYLEHPVARLLRRNLSAIPSGSTLSCLGLGDALVHHATREPEPCDVTFPRKKLLHVAALLRAKRLEPLQKRGPHHCARSDSVFQQAYDGLIPKKTIARIPTTRCAAVDQKRKALPAWATLASRSHSQSR